MKGGRNFFSYDQKLDRYAGALQLNLGSWTLSGISRSAGSPRNAPIRSSARAAGTTMRVTVGLTQNVPSPTFTISGIGLLVGLHRRADGDAMRDALPTGAIDALMFPSDPLGRTTQLVAALATMFPPASEDEDTHVAGVLIKATFAGGFANAKLGFLVQWGTGAQNLTKILIPFSATIVPTRRGRTRVLGRGHSGPRRVRRGERRDRHPGGTSRNWRVLGGDLVGGARRVPR